MDKQIIVEELKNISNIIQVKGIQHDEKVNLGLKACELYKKLNEIERKNMIYYIYIIYRQLGSLYLESNQYMESEKYFERSLEIKYNFKMIDSFQNECITKQMLAKEKIMIYLNTNNKLKIDQANELIEFITINYNDEWSKKFKDNFKETKEIYNNVIKSNIKTVVNFEIPYHMLIKDDEKIEFNYNGTKCSVLSRTIRTQDSSFIIGNNIYTQKDKYGIINHSILTVEIGRYINGNELVQVNRAIDSVYAPLTEAIDVYNYFVKKYIISTNRYWIPEINENMIFRFETKVFAGNIEIKNIPFSTSMSISSTGSNELCLSVEEIKKIKEELKSTDDLIWRIAVNYAKNYYLIKDYKNAIIMINIALENFSYKFARDKLVEYMSDSEIEEFFNGKVKYEDYFLKDYIEKEDFEKAKKNGIIKDNPPTIYKIYTECYKYEKFKISKSKLNKKISLIKDQRNEIVHGKKISKNLRYVAENAIEEFEELVKELN